MAKLVVCGDSNAAASVHTPGKHFSELLADKMGYELISLARGGMSNAGICLQIEYAINTIRPDFIYVSLTDSSRTEIPYTATDSTFFNNQTDLWDKLRRGYDISRGLENVVYDHKDYLSCQNTFLNKNPTMRSDNVGSLTWEGYYKVTKQQKTAMQYYITELFDMNWKQQLDIWCVKHCVRELVDSRIPFLIRQESYLENCTWLPEINCINSQQLDYGHYARLSFDDPTFVDPGYHTKEEYQREITDLLYPYIEKILQQ
jgi:hypothetical protein